MSDVLTAIELNHNLVNIIESIRMRVIEYEKRAIDYAEAKTMSEFAQATNYPQQDKRTVDEKRALVTLASSKELFAELKAEALRNSADRALKADMGILSAYQSIAAVLKQELMLARTDNLS